MQRARAILLLFLLLGAIARPVAARERIAVFTLSEDDPALAENLTELTISRLASLGDRELVGMRELSARLSAIETVKQSGLGACLASASCLVEVGRVASAERGLILRLRRDEHESELHWTLVDLRSGSTLLERSEHASSDVPELIATVQTAVDALFATRREPTAAETLPAPALAAPPPQESEVRPERSPPARSLQEKRPVPRFVKPNRSPAAEYIGLGATALAVVALSAATITGTIAGAPASGDTRAARQADLASRQRYATAANILFASGAAFAAVATVAFVWR